MSAILALRAGLRAALVADATLTGLIGGAQVWDERPIDATPPFLTFGPARASPTTEGPGATAHRLELVAWSLQGGDGEALTIAHRAAALLDDAAPPLAGHRIVALRVRDTRVGRPDRQGLRRTIVTLDALTQAIS